MNDLSMVCSVFELHQKQPSDGVNPAMVNQSDFKKRVSRG